ncbi:hypothetical protein [Adhaeribacter pallidiroseus]|uniref:Uncharacterized protein n=1 Tax=Adhaeribacter pallidiroseus TaxID=2072847 RepID=A0A369QIS3_9BACT|nr:hypothetical protein [Adhaeribacter pallidiroseus]RDC64302.1 hypothetical protein AHMF7616_02915 [Adhaeribacter pallidiroseus]
MQKIEVTGRIDNMGILRLDDPLKVKEKKVKVIIFLPEEEEDTLWLKSITHNAAFDFLHNESEDIYRLTDGQPFND